MPNLLAAHRKSYDILKAKVKGPVGITLSLNDFQAEPGGEALRDMADQHINGQFLEATRGDDYVGVQTYTRVRFGADGPLPLPDGAETTLMGYEFYPEALEATIRQAAKVSGCPVIVTENGIGTQKDIERMTYTRRALAGVLNTLRDGVDVRGYFVWTFTDNFEWTEGFHQRFGLVYTDFQTQARIPKASFAWYRDLIAAQRR